MEEFRCKQREENNKPIWIVQRLLVKIWYCSQLSTHRSIPAMITVKIRFPIHRDASSASLSKHSQRRILPLSKPNTNLSAESFLINDEDNFGKFLYSVVDLQIIRDPSNMHHFVPSSMQGRVRRRSSRFDWVLLCTWILTLPILRSIFTFLKTGVKEKSHHP